jgi:HEAT repeat protein
VAFPKTQLTLNQIAAGLASPDGTIILATLQAIEALPPNKHIPPLLEAALVKIQDPILIFQIRKTWRRIGLALRGKPVVVQAEHLEKLLPQRDKLEDLALAVSCLEHTEAILAVDLLRAARWFEYPALILPTFCLFFKKYGNLQDAEHLVELSRHPDPTILTCALEALEVVDPSNLQSLITPLLSSPLPAIRGQAIRALYRYDKAAALKNLAAMLLSGNHQEQHLALHYASLFPFSDVESLLVRFVAENSDPKLLMRISQIMKDHAHPDLPFRLYWICRKLKDQHQNLVKGILMGVARALCEQGIFTGTAQEYLDQLKDRVRREEERMLKSTYTASAPSGSAPDGRLPEAGTPAATGISAPERAAPAPGPMSGTAPLATPASGSTTTTGVPEPAGLTSPAPPAEAMSLPALEALPDLDPPSLLQQKRAAPAVPSVIAIEEYQSLDFVKRVQWLGKLTSAEYSSFRSRIPQLMREAKGKELAALLKAIGRFGTSEDAGMIRRFLNSENPDEVCAAIDALSKLDSEYLSLYLPQLMQSRNGKIRVTATRIFSSIDHERIKSLLQGLLRSPSARQRQLAMPATMLVDFPLIREALIAAFVKESNPELIEKLGVVLAANPDREMLRKTFRAAKTAGRLLESAKFPVVRQIAEKLAIALEKTVTVEQLLADEEKALADDLQKTAAAPAPQAQPEARDRAAAVQGGPSAAEAETGKPVDVKRLFTGQDEESKGQRARLTMIVWLLVILVWGFLLASYAVNFLFGGG